MTDIEMLNAENDRLTKLVIELRAEVVRLNAQAVPEISTAHGPWVESNIHEGETYCNRCLVRSVFAGNKKCEPHIVSAPAAPQPAQPLTDEQANCWCESCDLAKGDPCGRTRMSICPNCGDKRCPRAKHHDNECQQANGIGVKND